MDLGFTTSDSNWLLDEASQPWMDDLSLADDARLALSNVAIGPASAPAQIYRHCSSRPA
jgi:hypothetical protein